MRLLRRHIFIPSDWHQSPVMGWSDEKGFKPDSPLQNLEGFLLEVEATSDTPTMPPPSKDPA